MKLLLTNDDGIDAPGLAALLRAAREIGDPLVAGPLEQFSGCSHRVTTDQPVRIERRADNVFAIDGTPADCVRLGLHSLSTDIQWVLAGINSGGNLGTDVHLSGTVAAVREGVLHGWPGIAVSHYRRQGGDFNWDRAVVWLVPLLRDLTTRPHRRGTFWNINLPDPVADAPAPEIVFCPLDTQPLPLSFHQEGDLYHYNGDYHQRRRDAGSDVDVCFRGNIAVTLINLYA
jgi:5'-nucleotidase